MASIFDDFLTNLDYADDVAVLTHSIIELWRSAEVGLVTSSRLGLHISCHKIEIQDLGDNSSIAVYHHTLNVVNGFLHGGPKILSVVIIAITLSAVNRLS